MRVYRICQAKHRTLDGEGARRFGGRWNPPDWPVVYTAESLALAVLEFRVNTPTLPDALTGYVFLELEVDLPAPPHTVERKHLPPNWQLDAQRPVTQALGLDWLRAVSELALRVPTAVLPREYNLLLNPQHPDFSRRVRIVAEEAFRPDGRLY
jgi:RES domain-containing protein